MNNEVSDSVLEQFLLGQLPDGRAQALATRLKTEELLRKKCIEIRDRLLGEGMPEEDLHPTDEFIAKISNEDPTVREEGEASWEESLLRIFVENEDPKSPGEETIF